MYSVAIHQQKHLFLELSLIMVFSCSHCEIEGQVKEMHQKPDDCNMLSCMQSEVYQTTSSPFKVSNMENSLNKSEIMGDNMNFASTSAITQVSIVSSRQPLSSQIDSCLGTDDCDYSLPITNEEELIDFETKLLDINFKTKYVVNSLERLTRKTLTSTVHRMLRKLFDDELLKEYSYMGQKKKNIFFFENIYSYIW
ncbi:kinesin-related protein 2-like [Aphis craccivora]|uniref:Kinesin-related protein 2-like n=1 Tax=Aphis craccivora TaxID=307492 RepID=A0A6G0YAT4_APHCR|nr:kinesin-related protein 2-like [Aphis craccivora]